MVNVVLLLQKINCFNYKTSVKIPETLGFCVCMLYLTCLKIYLFLNLCEIILVLELIHLIWNYRFHFVSSHFHCHWAAICLLFFFLTSILLYHNNKLTQKKQHKNTDTWISDEEYCLSLHLQTEMLDIADSMDDVKTTFI